MNVGVSSTGFIQKAEPVDKVPDFDPRSGDHYWVFTTMYKVDPEKMMEGEELLDMKNLVLTVGPGCFHCEEIYTPYIAKRHCRGSGS